MAKSHNEPVKKSPIKLVSKDQDTFDYDRLFEDADSFYDKNSKNKDIQYPRGASLSKKSPIIKELFSKLN